MDSNSNKRNSSENLKSQKIRADLLRDVQDICKETCHQIGLDITSPATELVTELVYKKLSTYGTDLMAFAKHANRATIKTDDVKLLARRCPSLVTLLNKLAPPTSISKKRKNKSTIPQEIQNVPVNGHPKQNENGPAASTSVDDDLEILAIIETPSTSNPKRRKLITPQETYRKDQVIQSPQRKDPEASAQNSTDIIRETPGTDKIQPTTPSCTSNPAVPREIFQGEAPQPTQDYKMPELMAFSKNGLVITPVFDLT